MYPNFSRNIQLITSIAKKWKQIFGIMVKQIVNSARS